MTNVSIAGEGEPGELLAAGEALATGGDAPADGGVALEGVAPNAVGDGLAAPVEEGDAPADAGIPLAEEGDAVASPPGDEEAVPAPAVGMLTELGKEDVLLELEPGEDEGLPEPEEVAGLGPGVAAATTLGEAAMLPGLLGTAAAPPVHHQTLIRHATISISHIDNTYIQQYSCCASQTVMICSAT